VNNCNIENNAVLQGMMENEKNIMQMIEGFSHGPNVFLE